MKRIHTFESFLNDVLSKKITTMMSDSVVQEKTQQEIDAEKKSIEAQEREKKIELKDLTRRKAEIYKQKPSTEKNN